MTERSKWIGPVARNGLRVVGGAILVLSARDAVGTIRTERPAAIVAAGQISPPPSEKELIPARQEIAKRQEALKSLIDEEKFRQVHEATDEESLAPIRAAQAVVEKKQDYEDTKDRLTTKKVYEPLLRDGFGVVLGGTLAGIAGKIVPKRRRPNQEPDEFEVPEFIAKPSPAKS